MLLSLILGFLVIIICCCFEFGAVKFDSSWIKAPVRICIGPPGTCRKRYSVSYGAGHLLEASRHNTTNRQKFTGPVTGRIFVRLRACLLAQQEIQSPSSSGLSFFFFWSFKKAFVQLPGVQHFHSWNSLIVYDGFKPRFQLWHEQTRSPPHTDLTSRSYATLLELLGTSCLTDTFHTSCLHLGLVCQILIHQPFLDKS